MDSEFGAIADLLESYKNQVPEWTLDLYEYDRGGEGGIEGEGDKSRKGERQGESKGRREG